MSHSLIAIFSLTLVAHGPIQRPGDSTAIVGLERIWLQTSDTTVLERILAPDFVHVTPGGHFLTRAQHLAWIAAHPHLRGTERRFASLDVRVYGNAAVATGVVIASDTRSHALRRTAFTDVFVKRDGEWRAVSAQEDPVTAPAVPPAGL